MIATSDFGGQALLLKWNQFCIENKISLFPVYLQDMIGYAGPLIIPGETACLHCLRQRQNSNLQEVDLRNVIEKNATDGQSVAAIHPSVIGILAHTTVFELTHFFGELPFPRPGRLIRVDLMAGITQSQLVLKIPRCAVCSTLNTTADVQLKKMTPMPGI